ncbi:uncharacterized protein LOC132581548 [Heteronotia binoei]|uniref:uncharacterized protein LOC132581548 n=1 Tax=Heteronotia binoei TaxID=13085 RepID=UPI00292D2026|nr:uncharacterized protein LOC132581548 [Heteronotia binoei]
MDEVMPAAESQGDRNIQPKAEPILVTPGTEVTIQCSLPYWLNTSSTEVPWYKEELNRSLHRIYQSSLFSKPQGKYSSPSKAPPYGSLTISNVQRNDSGVYYCTTPPYRSFASLQRTRLIVTNTSGPTFSILAPPTLPKDQVNHTVPLLCLIFDADPTWENVSWDIDGETSQAPKHVDMIDANGVFSIWSLKLVPPKSWTQGATDRCSVQPNGRFSAAASANTGSCNPVLHFGVPCVVILLVILSLILRFRKHLTRGKVKQPASPVHTREIPQVNYADLRYNSPNVVETD